MLYIYIYIYNILFCFLRREIDLKVLKKNFRIFKKKLDMFWRKLGILIPDPYLTM
jgi:hypothetical protein